MNRFVFGVVVFALLAVPHTAFAQSHSARGLALGWYTDASRSVLGRFRGAKIVRLQREYGVRHTAVTVRFMAYRNGRVDSARIDRSSGNAAFDQRIIQIVQSVKLPPIPANFTNEKVALSQTIAFH